MTQSGAEKTAYRLRDRRSWHGRRGHGPRRCCAFRLCAEGRGGSASRPARGLRPRPNARAYADVKELVADPSVQAVYIATPHQFHAPHAMLAAEHGKHIILEKPMALTLADCDTIIAAVERYKVHLVVGHTHAFDPNVRLMRDIIARGELGKLGLINSFNYTNYLYRPRRPEELDTSKGGGILFNQVPHQIDTARLLAGGVVQSVRALASVLDPSRPTEGAARRCCNSTTALQHRWSTAATIISIRTNGIRHRRARRAEADRAWRGPPRAGKGGTRRRRAPKPSPTATRPASCRRTSRISASPSSPARRRHARLRRRRHDLRPRRHREIPIPRGGSMPAGARCWTICAAAIRTGAAGS